VNIKPAKAGFFVPDGFVPEVRGCGPHLATKGVARVVGRQRPTRVQQEIRASA